MGDQLEKKVVFDGTAREETSKPESEVPEKAEKEEEEDDDINDFGAFGKKKKP